MFKVKMAKYDNDLKESLDEGFGSKSNEMWDLTRSSVNLVVFDDKSDSDIRARSRENNLKTVYYANGIEKH